MQTLTTLKNHTMHRQLLHHQIFHRFGPQAILVLLALLLLAPSLRPGYFFGSSCDWYSQYVSIAETMRSTFYEEGTLFPGQLPLGGGSNIYQFAYYGYLRPDVLLGCLLPSVSVDVILTVYAIGGYLLSILLFYHLLKKCGLQLPFRFFGSVLFLCAGCFFQIHRQIVFVNYMPFLLGALLSALYFHRRKKGWPLVLMLFLIHLHSFYYSIACLLSVFVFLLHTAPSRRWKEMLRLTGSFCKYAFISVLLAGILLLPTAFVIFSCAGAKDGGTAAAASPLAFHLDFSGLLYSPYGYGLTLTALFLLLLALWVPCLRAASAFVIFGFISNLLPYVLNGFLYSRSKILMPFLPLALLLCMQSLQWFWRKRKTPHPILLLPMAAVTWLQYQNHGTLLVFADLAAVLLLFLCLSRRSSASGPPRTFRSRLPALFPGSPRSHTAASPAMQRLLTLPGTLTFLGMTAFLFAAGLHLGDPRLSTEEAAASHFSDTERTDFCQDPSYRFDTFLNPYQSANRLLAPGTGRSSAYTSTGNPVYSSFYFDQMRNPIRINNRVALLSVENPFFLYLNSVRYLETSEDRLPWGYTVRQRNSASVLAENTNVLPLCYGSTALLSQEAWEQLPFPDNLEAITSRSVVPSSGSTSFTSHFREIFPEEGRDYTITEETKDRLTVVPAKPLKDQILAVTFRVQPLSDQAVVITINGVRNKLSGADAPYPNHNTTFTYLLSSPEEIRQLTVETQGKFQISDLHCYTLDTSCFGMDTIYPFQNEDTSGNEVLKGTIRLPEDGYFITSLPLESGYQAWADGAPASIQKVNGAYLGIPLAKGEHSIRLTYEPPLQKAGGICSLAGLLVFFLQICLENQHVLKKFATPSHRTKEEKTS